MSADSEYSTFDLRQMDREEAERTLTKLEFDRWEKLTELRENAQETRERFAQEDEQVTGLVVNANMEDLGTAVTLYDNDLLVRANPDDPALRKAAEGLERELDGNETTEVPELDDETREQVADAALDMIDALLVRWGDNDWADLPAGVREATLDSARTEWGIDGLMAGLMDILQAIHEDQEERADVVESFRNPERRGNR